MSGGPGPRCSPCRRPQGGRDTGRRRAPPAAPRGCGEDPCPPVPPPPRPPVPRPHCGPLGSWRRVPKSCFQRPGGALGGGRLSAGGSRTGHGSSVPPGPSFPMHLRGSTGTTRGTAPAAVRLPGAGRRARPESAGPPPACARSPRPLYSYRACAQKTPSSLAKQTGPTGAPAVAFPDKFLFLYKPASVLARVPPRPPHPGAFPGPSRPPGSTARGLHDLRVRGSPQVHSSLGPLGTGSWPPPLVPIWVAEARRLLMPLWVRSFPSESGHLPRSPPETMPNPVTASGNALPAGGSVLGGGCSRDR